MTTATLAPHAGGVATGIGVRAGHGLVTTHVISDSETFVRLESEWNDAVSRAQVPHPFLRHEWFRTWWECFGAGRRLHIIVIRHGGQIAAIAPLMSEPVQMYGLRVRKYDLLHNDHTPRADFIVADAPLVAYPAIWNALRAICDRWDVLQLSRLPDDSPTRMAMASLAYRDGYQTGSWRGDVSPYLPLPGTWENYHSSLSSKFRSNLRNRVSRLRAFGEPRLEVIDEPAAIDAAREDVLRLEASGWKHDARTSIASNPAVEQFYGMLARRAADRGWLRLMFLSAGGRRIAMSYGSCFDNRLFLFKTGYDPQYATCSPFKLLTRFAIERAYAEGLSEIDFLGDAEPWKLEWTAASRPHEWLFVFNNTVKARLLHSLKFRVAPELKRWRA